MDSRIDDLDALEKRAFRRFYEDGTLDLVLGLTVMITPLGYMTAEWLDSEGLALLVMFSLASIIVGSLLIVRHRLVRTRLGSFTPREPRRRKINRAKVAFLGSMVLGVVVFAVTAVVPRPDISATAVEVILPVVWFVNAAVVLGLAAYFLDVPRFALYGVLFGLIGPLLIWPDVLWGVQVPPAIVFGVAAGPIVAIGAWKLARFLQEHPAPPADAGALDGHPAA